MMGVIVGRRQPLQHRHPARQRVRRRAAVLRRVQRLDLQALAKMTAVDSQGKLPWEQSFPLDEKRLRRREGLMNS